MSTMRGHFDALHSQGQSTKHSDPLAFFASRRVPSDQVVHAAQTIRTSSSAAGQDKKATDDSISLQRRNLAVVPLVPSMMLLPDG